MTNTLQRPQQRFLDYFLPFQNAQNSGILWSKASIQSEKKRKKGEERKNRESYSKQQKHKQTTIEYKIL